MDENDHFKLTGRMKLRSFVYWLIPASFILMNGSSCNQVYFKGRSGSGRQLGSFSAAQLSIQSVAFRPPSPLPPRVVYLKTLPGIADAAVSEGRSMMNRSDCYSCHGDHTTLAAPSYVDIARKYRNDPGAVRRLAKLIISGSKGIWDDREMKSHPELLQEDAEKMVKYILSLKGE